MLRTLRHKTTALAQRALAIDALHRKVDLALGKLEGIESTIDARARSTEEELRKLEEHLQRFGELFHERILISEPWLPREHLAHSGPEYYLAAFLYNFLPNQVLLDVGANAGDFAEVVSDSGYQVYCFEPCPATFARLKTRMANRGNVKTLNFALGSTETTLLLYVASESSEQRRGDPSLYNTFRPHFVREGLAFAETVEVPVRTIESLVKGGELPGQIDFLKVDTEGFDLEVIKGLGNIRPAVVQTEFRGDEIVFVRNEENRQNLISSVETVREMRNRNYFWSIIVFRTEAENCVRFGTNLASAPKNAWGNMLFFRDHSLFLEALRWCQGVLPRFQASHRPDAAEITRANFVSSNLTRTALMSEDSINPPEKAVIERTRYNQIFAVVSWGCAATQWLAKALNSHPEILCLHAGNAKMGSFHITMDSIQYLTILSNFGEGYKAVGDVHGLSATEISKLKEAFGSSRFNAVIVVREPIARLRSLMALYEHRGLEPPELSYAETLIEQKNIHAKSEESKMFVHGADMLNVVTQEIAHGTIYKAEDLTTNPNILAAVTAEITGGQIGMNQEWLETCVGLKMVNTHAKREAAALNDWQVDVVRRVVSPESWRIYEALGYVTPPFVDL
jgi:FkbM family methyltransferase